MKSINEARDYAIEKHWGQDYGNRPYIYHLDSVASVLKEAGLENDVPMMIMAYLHDVLEDTDVTYEEMSREFGLRVTSAVYALSNDGDIVEYYKKLKSNSEAIGVKLADRVCNLLACCHPETEHLDKLEGYLRGASQFSDAFEEGSNHRYEKLWDMFHEAVSRGQDFLDNN